MTLSKGKNIRLKKQTQMLSNFLSEEKRTSVILQDDDFDRIIVIFTIFCFNNILMTIAVQLSGWHDHGDIC